MMRVIIPLFICVCEDKARTATEQHHYRIERALARISFRPTLLRHGESDYYPKTGIFRCSMAIFVAEKSACEMPREMCSKYIYIWIVAYIVGILLPLTNVPSNSQNINILHRISFTIRYTFQKKSKDTIPKVAIISK